MIVLLLPLAGGFVAALGAWATLERVLDQPLFRRPNYRGVPVPLAGGVVLVVATLAVVAAHSASRAALLATDARGAESLARTLVAVLGFGFLGLLDDLAGPGDPTRGRARGLRGHVRAATHGELSTGMLKLVGGLAVAAAAVPVERAGLDGFVRDVALVALAANLANLFDRAPGRALKLGLAAALALAVSASVPVLVSGAVAVAGAAAALVVFDLRERLMLGDGGANPLGAALGLGVVLSCSPTVRLVVLAVLVALNAASEFVSFSAVIDRVPPLRSLDRFGRRREPHDTAS